MHNNSLQLNQRLKASLVAVLVASGLACFPTWAQAEELDTTATALASAPVVTAGEQADDEGVAERAAAESPASADVPDDGEAAELTSPANDTPLVDDTSDVTGPLTEDASPEDQAAEVADMVEAPEAIEEPAADAAAHDDATATDAPDSQISEGTASVQEQAADESLDACASTADALNGRTFVIESALSDPQVADAKGGKATKGTNVQTYAYNGSSAQKWKLIAAGSSYYYIASTLNLNYVLDVSGAKAASGANVQVWSKNGSDAQLWRFNVIDEARSLYSIISKLSGIAGYDLVLDVSGAKTANGTNLQIYKASGNNKAQRFYLVDANPQVAAGDTLPGGDGVYAIRAVSAASSKSYTVSGYTADVAGGSKANNANLRLYRANDSNAQRMLLTSDGNGYYAISVLGSAKVFDVAGAKIIPGTNVQQYQFNGSDAQKWALQLNENGTCTFVNKGTGLVLDLGSTTLANGTNLQGYRPRSTGTRQQFALVKDATGLLSDGLFTISPLAETAKVFDIKGGYASTAGTGYLQLYTANESKAQVFEVMSVGDGTYRIRTASSGGWLTGGASGVQVTQTGSSKTEDAADRWQVLFDQKGYWALQNVRTQLVLDLRGGKMSNSTAVQTYASNGSDAQRFILSPADLVKEGVYFVNSYYVSSEGIQQALDVRAASTEPGANIRIYNANGSDGQRFIFLKQGAAYRITNYNSGYAVTVSDVKTAKANVTQKRITDDNNQLWRPTIADDGFLTFVNVASGMAFEAQGSEALSNVVQHDASVAYNGGRWKLVATTGSTSYSGKGSHADVRILMIGNSFTYRPGAEPNYLPTYLEEVLDGSCTADVTTRSYQGKTLAYLTNPNATDEAAAVSGTAARRTQKNYANETLNSYLHDGCDWDYVIIQELSTRPIDAYALYYESLTGTIYSDANTGASYSLLDLIEKRGASPILYATWAFEGTSETSGSATRGITTKQMHRQLQAAFENASAATGAAIANVGGAFADRSFAGTLYATDLKHPSDAGSRLAAETIADTILGLMSA